MLISLLELCEPILQKMLDDTVVLGIVDTCMYQCTLKSSIVYSNNGSKWLLLWAVLCN